MKKIIFLFIAIIFSVKVFSQSWQWARKFDGTAMNVSRAIITDAANNIYVAGGYGGSSLICGNDTFSGGGILIVKFDSLGTVVWARSAIGQGGDICNSITLDANANLYVTGSFNGSSIIFGTDTITNHSTDVDAFIAKFDSSGTPLWAKGIGGNDYESASGIAIDSNSNTYITGSFLSDTIIAGPFTVVGNASGPIGFIMKYDSNGNELWAKKFGEPGSTWCNDMTIDINGNLYLTGSFDAPSFQFGNDTLINLPLSFFSDFFLIKYDTSGNEIWARSSVQCDDLHEVGRCLTTDSTGNIYVGGSFNDTIIFNSDTLTALQGGTNFLSKFDSAGNALWGHNITKIGNWGSINHLFADKLGRIILSCDSNTIGSSVFSAFFVSDLQGNIHSLAPIYESAHFCNSGKAAVADMYGNIFCTGTFGGSSPIIIGADTLYNTVSAFNYAIFTAKLSGVNCFSSYSIFPDTSMLHTYWVMSNSTGVPPLHYLWNWGDSTYDSIPFPSHTYAAAGFYNICLTITDSVGCSDTYCNNSFLSRIDAANTMVYVNVIPYSVGLPRFSFGDSFFLYPNPATSEIRITNAEFGIESVEVFDVMGRRAIEHLSLNPSPQGEGLRVDVSLLAPGIYFVKVRGEKEERVGKFVKQ